MENELNNTPESGAPERKPQVLSSEYLFRRPWLTVRRDSLKLPNGKLNPEFYVLEYPSWVNVTAITEDGMFVMIRQYRHGLGQYGTELCAGVVEKGEEPLEAAKRELQCVISGNPSTTNNLTYCYLARGVKLMGEQHLDPTEDVEVVMMTRDEVYDLLASDKMKQALMAAPLWRYFALECQRNLSRQ